MALAYNFGSLDEFNICYYLSSIDFVILIDCVYDITYLKMFVFKVNL